MKPRYAIVDEVKRDWFEKEFQLPFGYSDCYITFDFDKAVEKLDQFTPETRTLLVIEKVDEDGREIVYRG